MKNISKSNMIIALTILLSVICMGISYPFIHNDAQSENIIYNDRIKEGEILDKIFQSTMPYYYQLKQKANPELQPYELFINQEDAQLSTQYAQEITDLISSGINSLRGDYSDVSYYILDKETEETLMRGEDAALRTLLDKKTSDQYAWYIIYSFDDKGILTIQAYHDATYSKTSLSTSYQNSLLTFMGSQHSTRLYLESNTNGTYTIEFDGMAEYDLLPVKNTTFVFAMDQTTLNSLSRSDTFTDSYWDKMSYSRSMLRYFTAISLVASIVLLLLKFPIPEGRLSRVFKRIPLEIHAFIIIMGLAFLSDTGWLIKNTLEHTHYFLGGEVTSILGYLCLYLLENFLFWFLIFGYGYCLLISIKDDVQSHTMKQHFLIVRCWRLCKQKLNSIWKEAQDFDLSDEDDKRLAKLIGINSFIVFVMVTLWGFGYFFLIIYTIVLFVLAKKYLKKIRRDYTTLLETTKHISQGNFDSDLQVDLGIFHAFKNDIQDIQIGFKEAVDKEVHSQRMKTELITNVSHDLKTPLTSIITYIDLLKKEDISEEERQKYLDTLDRNSIRLKHLIEDLFEVSKANSGNVKLEPIQMDICSLMKQVQVELNDKLTKKNLTIRNTFSDEKILCYLDPQKTYRIFENLVSNISKYALENTRVYIEITDYDAYVDVTLRNISADELRFDPNDITERFTRGDSSRNTEGSGLGLAIAKSFTEIQSGTLKVHTDGDLFKVSLRFTKQKEASNDEEVKGSE